MNKPIDMAVAKQELERINKVLKEPHLLIGGLAVQQYHVPRRSFDIDLVCTFETASEILKLYPSNNWTIRNPKDDEYRPSYKITHRYEDKGEIVFGPKIIERDAYANMTWDSIMTNAKPFSYKGESLPNILVPSSAALAFTKLLSFIGRSKISPDKALQDLQDFVDLTNHESFLINELLDILRRCTAEAQIRTDFAHSAKGQTDILLGSSLFAMGDSLSIPALLTPNASTRTKINCEATLLNIQEALVEDPLTADRVFAGSMNVDEFVLHLPTGSPMALKCYKKPFGGQMLVSELPTDISGSVLDLGTGCGVIGLAAAKMGAFPVVMIDIVRAECDIARENAKRLGIDCTILSHDYFHTLPSQCADKYDWILSNPPLLPSRTQFDRRECGGTTGWDHVDRILSIAKKYLAPSGHLMLYVLDMLGITDPTGDPEPFGERAERAGFEWDVLKTFKRKVGLGSPVFRELRHIAEIYPDAEFLADDAGGMVLRGNQAIDHALRGRPIYITTQVVDLTRKKGSERNSKRKALTRHQ